MYCDACNAEMPDDHTHEDMPAEESTEETTEGGEGMSEEEMPTEEASAE